MKQRKVLIFIHKSLGELDWIAPFIKSEKTEAITFSIYLHKVGVNKAAKMKILEDYGLNKDNITLIDANSIFKQVFNFFNRQLRKLITRVPNSDIDYLCSMVALKLGWDQNFDFIFREYQLRESFELSCFLNANENAQVVVFPHSVGLQRVSSGFEFEDTRPKVKAALWLENSELSTRDIGHYRDVFFASGAPGLSDSYTKESLFSATAKSILINTRNKFKPYGSDRKKALIVFDQVLSFCQKNNLTAYIKHHPRDKRLYEYRDIQDIYPCAVEFDQTLNNINIELRACLSFYSSSGLFLTARQVPVFDITPYMDLDCINLSTLGLHYAGLDGQLTHDYIEIGIQEKLDCLELLFESNRLLDISVAQFQALKANFPSNSNYKIVQKLEELLI